MVNVMPDQCTLVSAIEFTQRLAEFWWRDIGGRVCGIYRIGSLAHGGFNGRYSDIDIAVIVDEPLSPDEIDRTRARAGEVSGAGPDGLYRPCRSDCGERAHIAGAAIARQHS